MANAKRFAANVGAAILETARDARALWGRFACLGLLALVGCQSYQIVQKNVFSDEDGALVTVEYGVAERDHVNTFVSPMTGQEMPFKSKLVVEVALPDGDSFKAWQCMNFQSRGTMYKTDSGRWQILVNGFTCIVYRQAEEDPSAYSAVYRGVLCDTPAMDVKRDDRWKAVPYQPKRQGGAY